MAELKLITETNYNILIKESVKKDDFTKITGVFSSADIKNANGRIYPKSILEREIYRFIEESVKNKCAWGELNHPTTPEPNLERVAILIEDLSWKGNDVYGTALLLDEVPMGRIAKSLLKHGKIGISSRGLGTINETNNYVNEDFTLLTYDLVSGPSNPGSWVNGIYEGQTFTIPNKKPTEEDNKILLEAAKKQYADYVMKFLDDISNKEKSKKKDKEKSNDDLAFQELNALIERSKEKSVLELCDKKYFKRIQEMARKYGNNLGIDQIVLLTKLCIEWEKQLKINCDDWWTENDLLMHDDPRVKSK